MKRADIEREVQRLAPWFYAWDLDGISTTTTDPRDAEGHRRVDLAAISAELWAGRSVLDVGCNEGGWAVSALDHGASRVVGFDCHPHTIERARFVRSVQGRLDLELHVESTDSWLEKHPGERFDYVFLCDLLHRQPDPWRIIEQYCGVAERGVLVTTALYGGADGYTPVPDGGPSDLRLDPVALPVMPNTTNTLFLEFAKHGFHPRYFSESRNGEHWGTCVVWLERWSAFPRAMPWERTCSTGRRVILRHTPCSLRRIDSERALFRYELAMYNETHDTVVADGFVEVRDQHGRSLHEEGPEPITLLPRPAKGEPDRAAQILPYAVELCGSSHDFFVEARLQDRRSGEVIEKEVLRVGRDG